LYKTFLKIKENGALPTTLLSPQFLKNLFSPQIEVNYVKLKIIRLAFLEKMSIIYGKIQFLN